MGFLSVVIGHMDTGINPLWGSDLNIQHFIDLAYVSCSSTILLGKEYGVRNGMP